MDQGSSSADGRVRVRRRVRARAWCRQVHGPVVLLTAGCIAVWGTIAIAPVASAVTVHRGDGPHNQEAKAHAGSTRSDSSPGASTTSDSSGGTPVDASFFTPGSCISFPPTSGDRHLTVFLDAGHGGLDPGSVGETESGQTVHESNLALAIELDATALLRARGYRVVVSRTGNSTVVQPGPEDLSNGVFDAEGATREVAARDVCANLARANLLVGIYIDAGDSSSAAGSMTDYDAVRPFSADNLRFAEVLQSTVLAAMNAQGWQIPDDGVVSDVYVGGVPLSDAAAEYDHLVLLGPAMPGYFSTPSEMPGALIEPLYITDPFEATIAASARGQHVVAGGIANAVTSYLGAASTPASTSPAHGRGDRHRRRAA